MRTPIVVSGWTLEVVLGLLAVGGLLALAWRCRRHPWVAPAALSTVVLLAVACHVPLMLTVVFAARLSYGPALALCALAGIGLATWAAQGRWTKGVAWAIVALVAVAQGAVMAGASTAWRNEFHHYLAMTEETPLAAKAHEALGYAQANTGLHRQARDSYNRALELWPVLPTALMGRGMAKWFGGDKEGALNDLHAAVAMNSADHRPSYHLGLVLQWSGRWAESIEPLQTSAKLEPSDADVWWRLALAYDQLKETSATDEALERALRVAPFHVGARRLGGVIALRRAEKAANAGRLDLAVGVLEEAVARSMAGADHFRALARLYRDAGFAERAAWAEQQWERLKPLPPRVQDDPPKGGTPADTGSSVPALPP